MLNLNKRKSASHWRKICHADIDIFWNAVPGLMMAKKSSSELVKFYLKIPPFSLSWKWIHSYGNFIQNEYNEPTLYLQQRWYVLSISWIFWELILQSVHSFSAVHLYTFRVVTLMSSPLCVCTSILAEHVYLLYYMYRVFIKNCVLSQFTATHPCM